LKDKVTEGGGDIESTGEWGDREYRRELKDKVTEGGGDIDSTGY